MKTLVLIVLLISQGIISSSQSIENRKDSNKSTFNPEKYPSNASFYCKKVAKKYFETFNSETLLKMLNEKLTYPDSIQRAGLSCKSIVEFTVSIFRKDSLRFYTANSVNDELTIEMKNKIKASQSGDVISFQNTICLRNHDSSRRRCETICFLLE